MTNLRIPRKHQATYSAFSTASLCPPKIVETIWWQTKTIQTSTPSAIPFLSKVNKTLAFGVTAQYRTVILGNMRYKAWCIDSLKTHFQKLSNFLFFFCPHLLFDITFFIFFLRQCKRSCHRLIRSKLQKILIYFFIITIRTLDFAVSLIVFIVLLWKRIKCSLTYHNMFIVFWSSYHKKSLLNRVAMKQKNDLVIW